MTMDFRVYAVIDLDRITDNIIAMKRQLPEHTGLMAVVKADGYGHGAVPISKMVEELVEYYGVATVEEAVALRHHGITKPILILGVAEEKDYETIIEQDICCTVFQLSRAKKLSETACRMGKTGKIHLAVDTGMNRIGMTSDEMGMKEALAISRLPGIQTEGIFTHFARADEADKQWADRQFGRFLAFVERLEEQGLSIPWKHCANSAGILDMKLPAMNLFRGGIAVYGLYPSDEVNHKEVVLKPALELKSQISYVKTVEAGQQISYGGKYITTKSTRVATVPVGYADGYPRALSGCGHVLIKGKKAAILGRICMDQMMVDVTEISEVKEGDCVTLIGRDGSQEITVEMLAAESGGFHYELLCGLSKRVPRVYVKAGKIAEIKDYFYD